MHKETARILLKECITLTHRLETRLRGLDVVLSEKEKSQLEVFYSLRGTSWYHDDDLIKEAGLTLEEVGLLRAKAVLFFEAPQ